MKKSKEPEPKVEEKKEVSKPKSPSKAAPSQPAKQTLDEDEILKIRGNLKKWREFPIDTILSQLKLFLQVKDVTKDLLKKTKIGVTMGNLSNMTDEDDNAKKVKEICTSIVSFWKKILTKQERSEKDGAVKKETEAVKANERAEKKVGNDKEVKIEGETDTKIEIESNTKMEEELAASKAVEKKEKARISEKPEEKKERPEEKKERPEEKKERPDEKKEKRRENTEVQGKTGKNQMEIEKPQSEGKKNNDKMENERNEEKEEKVKKLSKGDKEQPEKSSKKEEIKKESKPEKTKTEEVKKPVEKKKDEKPLQQEAPKIQAKTEERKRDDKEKSNEDKGSKSIPKKIEKQESSSSAYGGDDNNDVKDQARKTFINNLKGSLLMDLEDDSKASHNLEANKVAREIEKELFNLTGLAVNDQYKDKARGILINFKNLKDKSLVTKIRGGEITAVKIIKEGNSLFITEEERQKAIKIAEQSFQARQSDYNVQILLKNSKEGIMRCGKCGSKRVNTTCAQIRRADEGMTEFHKCLDCGKSWKGGG